MMMGSFLFKQKAREMLKGNWQTALVVSFFSGVLLTVAQVLQSVSFKDVQSVMDSLTVLISRLGAEPTGTQTQQVLDLYNRLFSALRSIPDTVWTALIAVNLLALVLTPALVLGCNYYFIRLVEHEDIGVRQGLFGRLRILPKALWLHVRMYAQIFLWSLLLVVPGIIAALRYSMAAYYLAEDPSLSAGEALRRSKEVMKEKGRKPSYFMLLISFVGWSLLISIVQMLLISLVGTVATLVASQFMSLALSTYVNASCAAFYYTLSHDNGLDALFATMRRRMKQAGISDSDIRAAGFGQPEEDADDESGADGGDDA